MECGGVCVCTPKVRRKEEDESKWKLLRIDDIDAEIYDLKKYDPRAVVNMTEDQVAL